MGRAAERRCASPQRGCVRARGKSEIRAFDWTNRADLANASPLSDTEKGSPIALKMNPSLMRETPQGLRETASRLSDSRFTHPAPVSSSGGWVGGLGNGGGGLHPD